MTNFIITLSVVTLVVGCSGSSSTSGVTDVTPPEGATSQQCTTFDTCPSYACSCDSAIVNSRRCVDNYCLDEAHTCASTCGTNPSKVEGGVKPGKTDAQVPKKDGSTVLPAAGAGDPCVPVSTSTIKPRVGAINAIEAGHMLIPATPANGSVNVSKTSAGRPSRITYDAAGTADDYSDDFSYNSAGRLSRFTHDAAGSNNDYSEDYSYTSAGLISHFTYDAAGSLLDYSDDFSYSSNGFLSHYTHDGAGSADDYSDDFSYTSAGLVSHFTHDAAGSGADVSEDFSYTSMGLVSHWTYDASGSTNDSSLDVSYNSSGGVTNLRSNGPRATGAVVKSCK